MKRHSVLAMCCLAGIVLTSQAVAKDKGILENPGGPVEFSAAVDGIRQVPVGDAMPGLHLMVKVEGRALDVYIAPADFCRKFDIKIAKGDEVQVTGTLLAPKMGEPAVVLTREITTGVRDPRSGTFHATLTVFLRNDDGPFWTESKAGQ